MTSWHPNDTSCYSLYSGAFLRKKGIPLRTSPAWWASVQLWSCMPQCRWLAHPQQRRVWSDCAYSITITRVHNDHRDQSYRQLPLLWLLHVDCVSPSWSFILFERAINSPMSYDHTYASAYAKLEAPGWTDKTRAIIFCLKAPQHSSLGELKRHTVSIFLFNRWYLAYIMMKLAVYNIYL